MKLTISSKLKNAIKSFENLHEMLIFKIKKVDKNKIFCCIFSSAMNVRWLDNLAIIF